jgi:hypothetical protein
LTIWRARVLERPPADHAAERLVVPAGEGHVEALEVQAPGGRRQETAAFLRGAGRWLVDQ